MKLKYTFPFLLLILFFTSSFAQYQLGEDIYGNNIEDEAGLSVSYASDNKRLAIGNRGEQVNIYEWVGGIWQEVGLPIYAEASNVNSIFAVSLSSDGNRVAIGAPNNQGDSPFVGHVRIYEWTGGEWQQLGTDIDGEAAYDQSGWSVSLSSDGNRVAIGAPFNDGNGSKAGHVRIYEWIGGEWQQLGTDIDGEAAYNESGWSVSLSSDGSRVGIGAIKNNSFGNDAGQVRIYELLGGAWLQLGEDINGETINGFLGYSVSLSSNGNRVAMGAPYNDSLGNNSGQVLVYELQGGFWQQIGEGIIGEATNDLFGYSVSISSNGDRVAIGAPDNDNSDYDAGQVLIYELQGGIWQQIGEGINGENSDDMLGYSVSLSSDGTQVAIGAPYNDDKWIDAGQVRVFDIFSIYLFNNNSTCLGLNNGSINIISNGLVYPHTYSYELVTSNGIVIRSNTFEENNFIIDALPADDYTFNIINEQSTLVHQETITVEEISGSIFEITNITTINSVNALPNGNMTITVDGGNPDYTISWSGPSLGSAVSGTTSFEILNLSPGLYSITIIDSNGDILEQDVQVLDETNPDPSCSQPLDIVILNDSSSSVDTIEYAESKLFFADFCAALNVGTNSEDTQVAIIEWSSSGTQIVKIPLTGEQNNLQNYVNSTKEIGGSTNPNSALIFGHDYLETEGRDSVTKVLVLSTDGTGGQVSNSLVALSESFQAEGYVIATIAFDNAFINPITQNVLQQTATLELLAPGAAAYSDLNETLAENIVNLYICTLDPGASNTVYFNRDGLVELDNYTVNGNCLDVESVDIEFTVTAQQQLAIPAGMPITFYYNNPEIFGATPIVTTYVPCAIEAGASETLTANLPVSGPAEIWAVLNDDGSQSPPINLPLTDIEESVFVNNIDHLSICVDPVPTVSVLKYTTTPIPNCGNTVIYTIDVCNISSEDLVEVEVNDEVPTGFVLLNETINDNGCAQGTNIFDIPVGCCVSITFEYDVSDAANGFYNDEDTELSGPSDQVYINFEGQNSTAEDVLIGGEINCDSDQVTLDAIVNITESCDDRFITCLFEITNTTNVALQSINFSAVIQEPSIWAGEPYFLNGLSLGATNITGGTIAYFTIGEIAPLSTASFMIDVFLGDWETSGSFEVQSVLAQLPNFVNGNGIPISSTSPLVSINAGINFITAPEVQITAGENANFNLSLENGLNPIWTTNGDGIFDDATSYTPIYTPGPEDIANGSVIITIQADNVAKDCEDGFTEVSLLIQCNELNATETINSCEPYTWIDGITYTESNNTASFLLTNDFDCDSLVTLNLTIFDIDNSITENLPTLTANSNTANYQWVDCDNNFALIDGETNQSFTPIINGSYAVQLTEDGCEEMSECVEVNVVSTEDQFSNKNIKLFPNPNNGSFQIDLGVTYADVEITIKNSIGQTIFFNQYKNIEQLELDLDSEAGLYFVEVKIYARQASVFKVIKN